MTWLEESPKGDFANDRLLGQIEDLRFADRVPEHGNRLVTLYTAEHGLQKTGCVDVAERTGLAPAQMLPLIHSLSDLIDRLNVV